MANSLSQAGKRTSLMEFNVPLNIILVISKRWKDDNERLCAMKSRTVMS